MNVMLAGFSARKLLIATILCSVALGSGRLASGANPPASMQDAASSAPQMEVMPEPPLQGINPWTAAAVYPTTIGRYAFAQNGQDLYVISGVTSGVLTNAVRRYNATTNVWTPLANIPVALEAPAAALLNGKIYVAGGVNINGVGTNNFQIYDIAANTWSAGPSLPVATWGAAAGAFNGNVYVAGGNFPPTTAVSIYNIASNTWSGSFAAPSPFVLGGYTQVGQLLYLIGSYTSTTGLNTTVSMRFDMATATWIVGPAWTPQRADFALAAVGTRLIAIGGDSNGGAFFDPSVQVDELDTSAWPDGMWVSSPDNLPTPRQSNQAGFFSSGRIGGEIWSTGGRTTGNVYLNEHLFRAGSSVPTNLITNGGSSIVSAGANGVLDPGEVVTVSLGAQNTGGPGVVCTTAALTGTLQATGGVNGPSGPQNYSMLCSGSPAVFRNFTFTVDPALPCGNSVTASLVMMDGATNYGTLNYIFVTGTPSPSLAEDFDGVVVPALPAGWTTTFSGTGTAVTTSTIFPDTAPNDIFLSEASNVGLSEVTSASIPITSASAKVSFRTLFNTEAGFDGLVLEIKIGAGAFQDILAAGGTFVSGGYNSTLATGFANPLPGRMAWSGLSGGTAAMPAYITTLVNLPAAASGQNIQLKWRQGSDVSQVPAPNPGSRIDTIAIMGSVCDSSAPVPSSAVSRKFHAGTPFDINLPLTGTPGVECRAGGAANDYTIVLTFAAPVTVKGNPQAQVTLGAGMVGTGGVGNGGGVSVSGTTVSVPLTNIVDVQTINIRLNAVNSGSSMGNVIVPMGVLRGDTNGDRFVNSGDTLQTRNRSGQAADATNFRSDVNTDGVVNSGDTTVVRARSGTALP